MLAHKLTSLILLLNNILIILVLKEAKAITLACNPSVCVLSRQSKWHINIKVCFFAHLWRVQGKISCAIHWLWCFCKLFTIKTLVQSEKFVTWFDLRKAWANVTVCTYLFLHILVFEGHTYSVSQKKPHWLDRLLYDWNELSYWHFQNLHKILFLYQPCSHNSKNHWNVKWITLIIFSQSTVMLENLWFLEFTMIWFWLVAA